MSLLSLLRVQAPPLRPPLAPQGERELRTVPRCLPSHVRASALSQACHRMPNRSQDSLRTCGQTRAIPAGRAICLEQLVTRGTCDGGNLAVRCLADAVLDGPLG